MIKIILTKWIFIGKGFCKNVGQCQISAKGLSSESPNCYTCHYNNSYWVLLYGTSLLHFSLCHKALCSHYVSVIFELLSNHSWTLLEENEEKSAERLGGIQQKRSKKYRFSFAQGWIFFVCEDVNNYSEVNHCRREMLNGVEECVHSWALRNTEIEHLHESDLNYWWEPSSQHPQAKLWCVFFIDVFSGDWKLLQISISGLSGLLELST